MARLLWPALLILAECMNKNILLSRAIISEPDPWPEIGLKEVVLRCVAAAPASRHQERRAGVRKCVSFTRTPNPCTGYTNTLLCTLDTAPASYWVSGNFNSSKTARRASNFVK